MTPDNRLQFPAPLIDFTNDVGLTGQDHDDFPAAGAQPRFDWLKMWFLALFSNQASYEEPTQYRAGTTWFDLTTMIMKIWSGSAWVTLASVIGLEEGLETSDTTTLMEWFASVNLKLTGAAPEATFSGSCTSDGVTAINIPSAIGDLLDVDRSRPFVFKNGLLIDPRNCEFFTAATVVLRNGIVLDTDDTFTVVVKNITSQLFHVPNVIL